MITSACFIDYNGLISGHGYIVKEIISVSDNLNLVKIRNIFSQVGDSDPKYGQWKGKYSMADKKSWTPQLKKAANYGKLKPGEFFMTLDDFKQGFKYYTITYVKKEFKDSFIEKRSSVNRRLYKFNFRIGEKELTEQSLSSSHTGNVKKSLSDVSNL